jgi:hypothetical protein
MRPLNFASQPFRNETLPAVLFGAASALVIAITIHHAFVVRGLLPARTSKVHTEVAALERELDRLRTEARGLKAPDPDKAMVAEWLVLKDLVDRRTFSWTGLFARLEQVLPREVRLVSIAPDVKGGQVNLEITAMARPAQAGLGLVGVLEGRGEFEDVYPVSIAEQEGGTAEFQYTMRYLPGVSTEPVPVPAVVTEEADEEEEPAEDEEAADVPTPAPSSSAMAPAVPDTRRGVAAPAAPVRGQRVPPRMPGRPQADPSDQPSPSPESREPLN